MTGRVTTEREAVVRLKAIGPSGRWIMVNAVIDTGFNGYLTLPGVAIAQLDLVYHSHAIATLAEGSSAALARYEGEVLWGDQTRPVIVLEADGDPLMGMGLLERHRLTLDVIPDGRVTIEPLPV